MADAGRRRPSGRDRWEAAAHSPGRGAGGRGERRGWGQDAQRRGGWGGAWQWRQPAPRRWHQQRQWLRGDEDAQLLARRLGEETCAGRCCGGGAQERSCRQAGWLLVGNLPGRVSTSALRGVFAKYGKVEKIHLMRSRSPNGRSSAFVQYLFSCEAALAVRTLHGAREMQPGLGPVTVRADAPGVFVENLPSDIKAELLSYVFSFYGRVRSVQVSFAGGLARAFVEYSSPREAKLATVALQEMAQRRGEGAVEGPWEAGVHGGPGGDDGDGNRGALEPWSIDAEEEGTSEEDDLAAEADLAPAYGVDAAGTEQAACAICLVAPRTHAFIPCGHRCVCADCGAEVMGRAGAACPICRTEAERLQHIFC